MTSARAASDLLYGCWMGGTRLAQLPEAIRPASRTEGYGVQALLEERSPSPLFGWKIAATSKAGQAHLAVDGPLAGRILAERLVPTGGTCPWGANHMRVVEMEFAFRMGATLQPRAEPYSVDEVMAAVASLHLSIEIPDSRYDDFQAVGAPQLIADNACASWFAIGEAAPEIWRDLDLSTHQVTGRVNGGPPAHGIGSNVLGDPRIGLAWLANELSGLGIALREGQTVSTGTCLVPMDIVPGDRVEGDYGLLGRIALTIGPDSQSG